MRNGNPIAADFGDEYWISYDGKEQRLAWALADSPIGDNLQRIADKESSKTDVLLPFEQQLVGIPSTVVDTSESRALRFVISIVGSNAEISLQGTLDGAVWFDFANGSYRFLTSGLYTIRVSPVIALSTRILYKSGTAIVHAQIGGIG